MTQQAVAGFVAEFLQKAADQPDDLFATFEGESLSCGLLLSESASVAADLRRRGLRPGDRAAVMMRNSRWSLSILFGLARAGIVWVPINAQQMGDGLRYIVEHSKPSLLIADEEFIGTIENCGANVMSERLIVLEKENAGRVWESSGAVAAFAETAPKGDDLFAIMYTSGTTGRPKGVMVTHGMLRFAGEAVCRLTQAQRGDVFFVWEPFFHIGGAQLMALPILAGIKLAMVERFSASCFWDQVREAGATHIHYLGGILQILLKQPEGPLDRKHDVRMAWGGGCPKDVWPLFRDRFGVEIRECYGMTEASSITTANTEDVVGSVGKPMPWFDVTIEDQDGNVLSAGERGEIVVRPLAEDALFRGYFENEEATRKALVNGALRTGDAGTLDTHGNLWFHGRLTDSVRCKGENVSAWEVEHVAAAHPDVEDCAMIGVAADIGEQDIKLFVKAKAGRTIDPQELSAYFAGRLAPYQNPRYIAVVGDFERTASQRIMKHLLPNNTDNCWDRLAGR